MKYPILKKSKSTQNVWCFININTAILVSRVFAGDIPCCAKCRHLRRKYDI